MLLSILQVNSEDLPERAIVCGDPARAELISKRLDGVKELAFSREYRTFIGTYMNVAVAVVSHGVGSAGAAVCFEELIRGGVDKLIRVGTAGSYHADIPAGSLVVSTAAAREEGLTKQLVPAGFPAIGDGEIADTLYRIAQEKGAVVKKGITVSLDAFFAGVIELPHKAYKQAGVLAVEMEIAALYVVSSIRGVRAGAILAVDGFADADLAAEYNPHTDTVARAVELEMLVALETLISV